MCDHQVFKIQLLTPSTQTQYVHFQNQWMNIIFFKIKKKRPSLKKHVHFQKQLVNITFSKARTCNYVGDTLKNMRFWTMWVHFFQIDFFRLSHAQISTYVFWECWAVCVLTGESVHVSAEICDLKKMHSQFSKSHICLKCHIHSCMFLILENVMFPHWSWNWTYCFFEDVTNCFL